MPFGYKNGKNDGIYKNVSSIVKIVHSVSVFVVENTNVFCAIRNNKRNRKIDWRYTEDDEIDV